MTDNQIRAQIHDLTMLIMDAYSNDNPAYNELFDAIQLSNSLQTPQAKDISLLHYFYRTLGEQWYLGARDNNKLDESHLREAATFFERGCPFEEEYRWGIWEAYLITMKMLAECSNQIEDGKHYFTLLKDVCDHYLDRLRDDESRDLRKFFLMHEYLLGRWCTKDLDQVEKLLNDLKRTSSSQVVRDAIPDYEAVLKTERSNTRTFSKKEKDSGGGCFLTSACVEAMGLPDDCRELTVLRHFRDTYMRGSEQGQADILEYYMIAPAIVDRIREHGNSRSVFERIYRELVLPCVELIDAGRNEEAYGKYKDYTLMLKTTYGG